MNRKILLTALSALAVITVLIVPAFAAPLDTLTPHAAIEGIAIVRTGRGRPVFDRDAVLTFWAYTPSGEVAGHEDPGFAVTLEVDGTLYVWHVTNIRACGRSSIVIISADPHPLPGLAIAEEGPSPIKIMLNHDVDRPFAVVTGRKAFFIGKTLVT